ncbi:MAG: two pore domain potassium channel family protein [Rhodospirillales bacterium]|nr:two pore domain potassium channel family protein [Alphaproteobacteria bacterium]MCB9977920.1 two pore domain potassium channel family protein [Rhodospirillales bacterium]
MFVYELLIGTVLICVTVVIHAVALDRLKGLLDLSENIFRLRLRHSWKVPMLILAVLGAFCSHIVQIWLWAAFYLSVDALPDLEEALYFSTTTFTTVGFGDVVLDHKWRLVSSFQAANGFILFGWSTAFIFEVMSKLYESDSR